MADITISMIKDLREKTGAGMVDCKEALVEADGNVEAAMELLRKKGMATAGKKAGRVTAEGAVGSYIHMGGKVGVNVPQGKNLIGAFYQPNVVVIDTDTLKTLPHRELICGLAECVKHGVIRDADLFDWIEANAEGILALDSDTLVDLVRQNVQIKANVVMEDEKESGVRAHLNFGHTFAHAVEATQKYTDAGSHHHGEAVALGMVAATRLAVDAGMCDSSVLDRLIALQDKLGLPTSANNLADNEQLLKTMRLDKKVKDGAIRLVLPVQMGEVVVDSTHSDDEIRNAWNSLRVL